MHFNLITKEILILQKYVAVSSLFLKNYFLQKCQNTIQDLSNRTKVLENELLPKKKFGFKNKKVKDTDTVDFVGNTLSNSSVNGSKIVEKYSPNIECGFYQKNNEVLELGGEEIYTKKII